MEVQRKQRTRYNKNRVILNLGDTIPKFSGEALCHSNPNPDLWFSEAVEKDTRGGPTRAQMDECMEKSYEALKICAQCNIKDECLREGMRNWNLDTGIWGGMLSGERLTLAGKKITKSNDKNAVAFAKKMRARYGYL